jgi:hypothetical protein
MATVYETERAGNVRALRRVLLGANVGLLAIALAAFGWLAGHSLTYHVVGWVPTGRAEADMHAYLSAVADAGRLGVSLALVALICVGWRIAARDRSVRATIRTRAVGTLHIALPAAAYVAAEVLERVAAHTPAWPGWPLLVVGIPVQALLGLGTWAAVRCLVRAAEATGRILGRARPRLHRPAPLAAPPGRFAPLRPCAGHGRGMVQRGPPSVATR